MKYYHIYADEKTVREISQQEYNKLSQRPNYFVCAVDDGYILFVKCQSVICVPKAQLEQVLNGNSKEA